MVQARMLSGMVVKMKQDDCSEVYPCILLIHIYLDIYLFIKIRPLLFWFIFFFFMNNLSVGIADHINNIDAYCPSTTISVATAMLIVDWNNKLCSRYA